MILSVQNQLTDLPETINSFITSNIVTGGTSLPVRNIGGFTAQYAVQVGRTGEQQSEIVIINTPSGTILPIYGGGTIVYNHNLDTPVYQIHYDQIIFKRSTVGTAGTAVALATVNITPNNQFTEYNDTSGASTYAYKTQFLNSVSLGVSSESDWFVPGGPTYYSLQKIRQRTKSALYNANYLKDDSVIDDWINEWLEEMTNSAIKVNQAYSVGTQSIAFGTAGLGTVTDATFKQPLKVELTFDGSTYINSLEIPFNQWSTQEFYSSVFPRHYWVGDAVFGVLPLGQAGTARLTFASRNTPLVNDTDEMPFTLRSYTTSCVNYVLYRAYDNDNKGEQADKYYNKYLLSRKDFVNEVTPRDQTGPRFINFLDGLSGRNDDTSLGTDWYL
jgi:hypothetical protein